MKEQCDRCMAEGDTCPQCEIENLKVQLAEEKKLRVQADNKYMEAYNEACKDLRAGFEVERLELVDLIGACEGQKAVLVKTLEEIRDGAGITAMPPRQLAKHALCLLSE